MKVPRRVRKLVSERIFREWEYMARGLWLEHGYRKPLHYWLHQTKWKFKRVSCLRLLFMR